jgi:hypothetical protein
MTRTQVVCVGDAAQAIYGWRGATDFMSRVHADHRTRRSQSFSFGQTIADEANVWLDEIGTTLRLTGNPAITSTIEPINSAYAVLCRTNAHAVSEVITAHNCGVSVALVGGGRDMKALTHAAEQLTAGPAVASLLDGARQPDCFTLRRRQVRRRCRAGWRPPGAALRVSRRAARPHVADPTRTPREPGPRRLSRPLL